MAKTPPLALLVLVLVLAGVDASEPQRSIPARIHLHKNNRLRAPPPQYVERKGLQTLATPSAQWFTQNLDHFNPTDIRTWQQRWFAQTSNYGDNGRVFIFIASQSEADPAWLTYGHTVELAVAFKAKLFLLEHRYYGESHPTEDLSTENLQWLTIDQALADLAYFIQYLQTSSQISKNDTVIVFGGLYSGNLAAWARLKYPDLIYGAIASSAPILAKADFVEYLEVVSQSLTRKAGQWCVDNIQTAFDRVVELIESGDADSIATVQSTFRVGKSTNLTDTLDLQNFYSILADSFSDAVLEDGEDWADTNINVYCGYMIGDNLSRNQSMAQLGQLVAHAYTIYPGFTLDYSYRGTLAEIQDVTWNSAAYRQFSYQKCTELGYYSTDNSTDTPFGENLFLLSYRIKMCEDAFGTSFNATRLHNGVDLTNMKFGGRDPDVTRVVFVNGDIDPWHSLGRLEDLNDLSPAILISGSSCLDDMQATSISTDSSNLTAARQQIKEYLRQWIGDYTHSTASQPKASHWATVLNLLLLCVAFLQLGG